jgi:hypothetical protein
VLFKNCENFLKLENIWDHVSVRRNSRLYADPPVFIRFVELSFVGALSGTGQRSGRQILQTERGMSAARGCSKNRPKAAFVQRAARGPIQRSTFPMK